MILLGLLLIVSLTWSSTKECREDPDFYRYITGTLGKGIPDKPSYIFLPCDTIIIQKGAVVKVSRNTYVSFSDPNRNNLIRVKGTLLVQGTPEHRVNFSRVVDTVFLDQSIMKSPWKGIEIDSGGSVIMTNGVMHGAAIPIKTVSNEVHILKSFFFGGSHFELPESKQYSLPSNFYVDDFDLNLFLKQTKAENQPVLVPDDLGTPIHRSLWLWGGIGVVLIGGGGYLAYELLNQPDGNKKHVIEVDPGL